MSQSFIVKVAYDSPKYLHLMHHTTKSKEFIIASTEESNLSDARDHQYQYIESFFEKLNLECENNRYILIEPISRQDLKNQNVFFCTEEPYSWKINVWFKKEHRGYITTSYSKERIFSIEVMEIHTEC